MTDYSINAITRKVSYSGSAGVGPYAFTFEIIDQGDVAVYKNATLLTLTTDYTVTINANGTGSVTLLVAATVNDTIVILGARDIERTTDFVTAGDLRAESLNEQLDSLVIFDQQIDERVDRSIRAPAYDPTGINMTLPSKAARANKVLQFDTEGDVNAVSADAFFGNAVLGGNYVNNTFTGTGSQQIFGLTVAPGSKNNIQVYIDGVYQNKATFSISGLVLTFTEAPPLNSAIECIIGESITNITGDASAFTFTQSGTGAQQRTVESKLRDRVSVKDFGAVGNGVADDSAAIQNALNYIRDSSVGGELYFPTGKYKCNSALTLIQTVNDSNRHWTVDGGGATLDFSASGLTSGALFEVGATQYVYRENARTILRNFRIIGPETQNAYVSGGPASPTPDGTTIGLYINKLLNASIDNVSMRRCYTGIKTTWTWPLVANHVVTDACYIGIYVYHTSTLASWVSCGARAARHGVVIHSDVEDAGIGSQSFYTLRVENCLRGVSIDQGTSASGTANQFRNISFFEPRLEQIAYDLFRIGKVWDFAVTNADSADRNQAYLNNVNIYGGRMSDPITNGYIVRCAGNDYTRGGVFNLPAGDFNRLVGNFALSKIFLQSRVDGGSQMGTMKMSSGTELQTNGGINLNTNVSYIDFQGFNTAGTGTRVSTKLDYYEEGTFVPNLWDSSNNSAEGQTYTTQLGYYTRIGNVVHFNIRLIATSLGTLTTGNGARISLPIASSASKERASVAISDVAGMSITSGQSIHGYIAAGSGYIALQLTDSASGYTGLLLSEFSASGEIAISGTYFV
jgi:hypothetical protein